MTTVLVTGAAGGIGRGLVRAFATSGWQVAATARRLDDARRAAADAGAGAVGLACDVTVAEQVEAAFRDAHDRFGAIDAVVHCAVSARSSEPVDLEHATLELWEEHASVSLRATWRLARAAFAPLRASGGSLLVLTSPAGINGSANLSFYAAVKGGQLAFVRSLAREWAADGIRVNGLSPLALTPALEAAFANDTALGPRITGLVPMGRLGDPEHDIGPPAVFLCSGAARYVTGQNLVVSGGRLTSA